MEHTVTRTGYHATTGAVISHTTYPVRNPDSFLRMLEDDINDETDVITYREDNTLYVAGIRADGSRYKMCTYRIED